MSSSQFSHQRALSYRRESYGLLDEEAEVQWLPMNPTDATPVRATSKPTAKD
jgi:hypothetical protein